MVRAVRRDAPRPRGPGRAILISVLVLLLVAVVVDLGLRFLAERWLEERMQQTLALERRPDLDIGGFPFIPQFARGEVERVDLTLRDLRVQGLDLDEVTIGLRRVAFNRADVLAGRHGSVRVRRGVATVEIDEPTLNGMLRDRGVPVSVELLGPRIRATWRIEVEGREATATAEGTLDLEGTTLGFDPGEVSVDGGFGVPPAALGFRVDLPPLFPGLTYQDVRVREAVLALRAALDDTVLDLG
ncbi:MAG TPA: DUF2993 domain-containing protein [Actinomycetota bacterium]